MKLCIESEDFFQKLLSNKILNPAFNISDEEIESEEFYEDLEEIYKNENFFHLNYYKLLKLIQKQVILNGLNILLDNLKQELD